MFKVWAYICNVFFTIMKFIKLTNNYRINIESIFSLEHQYLKNKEYDEWKSNYDNLLDAYQKSLIPLKKENGELLKISENSSEEDIKEYAQLIAEEIYDKIGEEPEKYKDNYQIILSTGLKISISKDKFDAINNALNEEVENIEL